MSFPPPSVTLYQPPWWHFLSTTASRVSWDIEVAFFMSFEDALWSLCDAEELAPGSLFLIPEFYCMDVVAQIEARGWQVAWYPFTSSFTLQEESLYQRVKELQPSVLILYHPVGMSSLSLSADSLLCALPELLLIEDCAHCLRHPSAIAVYGERHVVIDSLRKVSPFQGSRIYRKKGNLAELGAVNVSFKRYHLMCLYQLWRCFLFLSVCLKVDSLWQWSEALFMRYNDRIGTAPQALGAPLMSRMVASYIDVARVKEKKHELVSCYVSVLREYPEYLIDIPENQWRELKCFPVLLASHYGEALIELLKSKGIDSDLMFAESPASTSRVVVMLPLPIHLGREKIKDIASSVLDFFQSLQPSNNEVHSLQENVQ